MFGKHAVIQGSHTVGSLGISGGLQMRVESTSATAAGKFVITLCSVATPVTIPQPRSQQLSRFKFFLGQSLEGECRRYTLYMGHFSTHAEAEKWLTVLRRIYPDAFVSEEAVTHTDSLSDTQVLSILEKRGGDRATMGAAEIAANAKISVLRPDDTSTRLALKDAVTRNAPVSFAVQLQCSLQPIGLEMVPRHPIFGSYTLYTTQARIEGRQWFCLRLGFFSEAISAKQIAQYLFSDFPSVAVVPVDPVEHVKARETGKRSAGAVLSAQARLEQGRSIEPVQPKPSRGTDANAPASVGRAATEPALRNVKAAPATTLTREKRAGATLEETLETLKTGGFAMDSDDESSATGVRHLQVVVEKSAAHQSKGTSSYRRKI
jgi:hypothetical protein